MENKTRDIIGSLEVTPKFINKSDIFWFSFKTGNGTHYYKVDPRQRTKTELFDRKQLAEKLSQASREPVNCKELNLWSLSFCKDQKTITFPFKGKNYKYHLEKRTLQEETKKDGKKRQNATREKRNYSWDSTYYVYVKHHNLYLRDTRDSIDIQLTTDGEPGYSYSIWDEDTSTYLPPNIRWFNHSSKFYALRGDKRNISSFHLVNNLSSGRPKLKSYKYVLPGDDNTVPEELILFDAQTKTQRNLNVTKWKNQRLSIAGLEKIYPNKLFFVRCSRGYEQLEICSLDPETEEIKVLFNEIAKPRFNTEFYTLQIINNEKNIIWWSERTGHGHYYLYDSDGQFKQAITNGPWTAGPIVKIDSATQTIFFQAFGFMKDKNPYYAQICKASWKKQQSTQLLTPEEATHSVTFSPSGNYFVDNYSRPDQEPRSVLRNSKNGNIICELARPDLSRLYAMGWKFPEAFVIKAADGITNLYGLMWKPFDFDSTKSYPIISRVYPGPHTEETPVKFTVSAHYNTALAQLGCIVVSFGQRGSSPLRGKFYDTYGYGNMRDYALADNKFGIEQLADLYSFIDISKVGIFGHSGGGMMATAALCKYPEFYTAAVASSGNHDNNIYNSGWVGYVNGLQIKEETSKKTIRDSASGKDSVITVITEHNNTRLPTNMDIAENIQGHLLLATGDMDDNVHPAHTFRMVSALIRAQKNFELVVLPGCGHLFSGDENIFFQHKMWFHFAKYLLQDYSCEQYNDINKYKTK